QADRLENGELFGKLCLLKGDAEQLAQLGVVPTPAPAKNDNFPRVGRGEPFADLDRGRLAGAVRSEQSKTLTGVQLEIEPVYRDDVTIRFPKAANRKRGIIGREWLRHGGMLQLRALDCMRRGTDSTGAPGSRRSPGPVAALTQGTM